LGGCPLVDILPPVSSAEGWIPPGRTPLQAHLDVRYLDPPADSPAGSVTVQAAARPELCGPAGSLEGGLVATLLDAAGASAAARVLHGLVATQALSICYTAPVTVGPARATGVPVRVGSRQAVVEVHLIDAGRDGELCATALLTAVRIGERSKLGNVISDVEPPADAGSSQKPQSEN
jgi:uncharacterized protein (TIGR00369 family)